MHVRRDAHGNGMIEVPSKQIISAHQLARATGRQNGTKETWSHLELRRDQDFFLKDKLRNIRAARNEKTTV